MIGKKNAHLKRMECIDQQMFFFRIISLLKLRNEKGKGNALTTLEGFQIHLPKNA